MRRITIGATLLFCFSIAACGGSTAQVGGDWSGTVRPAHFDILQISLTQDGKTIRGTACYVVGNGLPNRVKFRDAAVTGSYPTIRVVASDGWHFEGEFQDDTLSGHYSSPINPTAYPMSLTRGSGPYSADCK